MPEFLKLRELATAPQLRTPPIKYRDIRIERVCQHCGRIIRVYQARVSLFDQYRVHEICFTTFAAGETMVAHLWRQQVIAQQINEAYARITRRQQAWQPRNPR